MFSLQELSAVRSHYYAPRCFRRRSRCCFIFVNGRPLTGTVWVQNDDFRLCRNDMLLHTENKATKCSDKISHSNRHIKKKQLSLKTEPNHLLPWAASTQPERFSPLLCSQQQRHPDFPWNLNQEMFQRVKDRSPSTQSVSLTLKEVIL